MGPFEAAQGRVAVCAGGGLVLDRALSAIMPEKEEWRWPNLFRGFLGRKRPAEVEKRLPPGQYLVTDFPVLSAGRRPVPRSIDGRSVSRASLAPASWSWHEFGNLPTQTFTVDISCVTKWTKLDAKWRGVSVDRLLEAVELDPIARYVTAFSDGGYTTNIPLDEMVNGQPSSPTTSTTSRSPPSTAARPGW